MKKVGLSKVVFTLLGVAIVPTSAWSDDQRSKLESYVKSTNKCIERENADPGGFDGLADCRWIYDILLREMKTGGHSQQSLNMMLYLTVQSNKALTSNSMVGKSTVTKVTCKYLHERRQIQRAYKADVTPHLDAKMKPQPFPEGVGERCNTLLSE